MRGIRDNVPFKATKLELASSFGIGSTLVSGHRLVVREAEFRVGPFGRLHCFKARRRKKPSQLLVVAPLSGQKSIILRDLIIGLLPASDVYLLEWADARDVPAHEGPFGMEQNIACILKAIKLLGIEIHLLGLCQSAAPLLAATSLLAAASEAAQPLSLILLAGLLDSRITPSRIERLARSFPLCWFEAHETTMVPSAFLGASRRVHPGDFQRIGLLGYLARHVANRLELFQKVIHDDGEDAAKYPFLDLYLSVIDLPAEVFLDSIRLILRDHVLANGQMTYLGQRIAPETISRSALMTIEGEFDDVSPPGQTVVAHHLCASVPERLRRHVFAKKAGHYGTFHGQIWRGVIAPQVRQFIDMAASAR